MKVLMTIAATVALTAAVNAQQSACAITNDNGTSLVSYNVPVKTVSTENGVNIVDRRTGAVLDFIPITSSRFGVRCTPSNGSSNSNEGSGNSSVTRNSRSGSTRNSINVTSSSDGNTNTTRRSSSSRSTDQSTTSGSFSSLLARFGF